MKFLLQWAARHHSVLSLYGRRTNGQEQLSAIEFCQILCNDTLQIRKVGCVFFIFIFSDYVRLSLPGNASHPRESSGVYKQSCVYHYFFPPLFQSISSAHRDEHSKRLTPAYLYVLGMNEVAIKHARVRTVFSPAIIDDLTCEKFWWRNALYLNSLYPREEMVRHNES